LDFCPESVLINYAITQDPLHMLDVVTRDYVIFLDEVIHRDVLLYTRYYGWSALHEMLCRTYATENSSRLCIGHRAYRWTQGSRDQERWIFNGDQNPCHDFLVGGGGRIIAVGPMP
jgi:hypothetical protein